MSKLLVASVCLSFVPIAACVSSEEEDEALASAEQALSSFGIGLWPEGQIPYRFASNVTAAEKTAVKTRMLEWETALTVVQNGESRKYINFYECTTDCPSQHIDVVAGATGSMSCGIGMKSGASTLNIWSGVSATDSTLLHELGHCIGLAHQHERADRDRWLSEGSYDYDYNDDGTPDGTASLSSLPILGNYDYDSIMHYASWTDDDGTTGTLRHQDRLSNEFSRWESNVISPEDISRVLQYYAREAWDDWDFFRSLAQQPSNPDALPITTLEPGVEPVGTPAIAGTALKAYVFVRGSNQAMYGLSVVSGVPVFPWVELGCCFDSDPAAVRSADGRVHVAAVGASSGKVMVSTRATDGDWGPWFYIAGGFPAGGIKELGGAHLGPALASRSASTLDLFVVRADGRLAVSSMNGAGTWSSWAPLGAAGAYNVSTRPAAVAIGSYQVRLAVVTGGTNLYEPLAFFAGGAGTSVTSFTLGAEYANVDAYTAPAIARRDSSYRTAFIGEEGRVTHKFAADGIWRDIGGIPRPGTGVSAMQTSTFGLMMVMNGADARGCDLACLPGQPAPGGEKIQAGGIWIRSFE